MNNTDILTPVDRYPGSPMFGRIAVDAILLWQEAGQNLMDGTLTGALKPYTGVEVLEYMVIGSNVYARVQAFQGGAVQAGWCHVTLLEKAGAEYFETMYGLPHDQPTP